jgi:glycosyltransferase involved in cell wall biosynthesis
VSAATAADISSVLHVPAHRISIVPSAVEDGFRPRPAAHVQRVRDRLSIRGGYFMYVGLAGVHKRVGWLAEQFLAAAPDCPAGTQLVIVGGQGAEYESVRRLVAEASRDGRVVFTGWLSDDDLAALYTGATACLSGSVKEGFDLPPAEALACGSEAIVTDIPAHREVLGAHAHYFGRDDTVRLRQLLVTAAHGRLPSCGSGFEPPNWRTASRELMRTLGEALRAA